MTKHEIKNGNFVKCRNGSWFVVAEGNIIGEDSWDSLDNYEDDLRNTYGYEDLDIVAVSLADTFSSADKHIIWSGEDYLDKVEKEYLKAVVKPFRESVKSIEKCHNFKDTKEFICINLKGDEQPIYLPYFSKGTMYKNLGDEPRTLKELGI